MEFTLHWSFHACESQRSCCGQLTPMGSRSPEVSPFVSTLQITCIDRARARPQSTQQGMFQCRKPTPHFTWQEQRCNCYRLGREPMNKLGTDKDEARGHQDHSGSPQALQHVPHCYGPKRACFGPIERVKTFQAGQTANALECSKTG